MVMNPSPAAVKRTCTTKIVYVQGLYKPHFTLRHNRKTRISRPPQAVSRASPPLATQPTRGLVCVGHGTTSKPRCPVHTWWARSCGRRHFQLLLQKLRRGHRRVRSSGARSRSPRCPCLLWGAEGTPRRSNESTLRTCEAHRGA